MDKQQVLIVDDNPQNIQLAAGHLKLPGVDVAFAMSAMEALETIAHDSFDLLLLDVMMPEMDGYELCRRVKAMPGYREVPVIFLTARGDAESVVAGFEAGAVDYISKPFSGPELVSRVQTHLRLRELVVRLEEINASLNIDLLKAMRHEDELAETREVLAQRNRELYEQATKDPLTGLANRRHIMAIAEYEQNRVERMGASLGIIVGDLDHFKQINDTLGHPCGDQVLVAVGELLTTTVRRQDQVARWGGEEFLILLPDTTGSGAKVLAEKARAAVEAFEFSCEGHDETLKLTMTFGVTTCNSLTGLDEAIRHADEALYEGKSGGRNVVVSA
jgi:diguanylate cyclase (GGDEF)-like protein